MGVTENHGSKAALAGLAAMHVELADKLKRSNNVIVSGLPPSTNGIPDADLFSNLCEEQLSVKPDLNETLVDVLVSLCHPEASHFWRHWTASLRFPTYFSVHLICVIALYST